MDRNFQFFTLEIFISTGVITAKDVSILVSSNPLLFHHFCHQLLSKITVIYVFLDKIHTAVTKNRITIRTRSLFNDNGDLDTALVYID